MAKKKKTLLSLLNGSREDGTQSASAQPVEPIAEPPAPSAPPVQVATAAQGQGYFVQLASFKTEDEAAAEYRRMKAKHGTLIGALPSSISAASVGGSTRYRLAVGPLQSQEKASGLCASLSKAGERDCLVVCEAGAGRCDKCVLFFTDCGEQDDVEPGVAVQPCQR